MVSADMGDPTGYIWFIPVCKDDSNDPMESTNPITGLDYLDHLRFLDLVCL